MSPGAIIIMMKGLNVLFISHYERKIDHFESFCEMLLF